MMGSLPDDDDGFGRPRQHGLWYISKHYMVVVLVYIILVGLNGLWQTHMLS